MGKKIHLSLGFLILLNLLLAWTVIGWILLMLNVEVCLRGRFNRVIPKSSPEKSDQEYLELLHV